MPSSTAAVVNLDEFRRSRQGQRVSKPSALRPSQVGASVYVPICWVWVPVCRLA
ncbi:MAG TPA: hypothetical protein VMK12_04175 [Anaeromyxobacteraceae bacterium]|nr:hypothetical protein [Anaeromyxobacteraceae bacterium]